MNRDTICYQKNPDFVFRTIANQCILVPIHKEACDVESIYTLNETASRIFELVDGMRSVTAIEDALVREFDVTPDAARGDIAEAIEQLLRINAITET